MNKEFIKFLDWDTDMLGVKSAIIDLSVNPGDCGDTKTRELLGEFFSRDKDIDFLTLKLSYEQLDLVNYLIDKNAKLLDAELTFKFETNNYKQKHLEQQSCEIIFLKEVESSHFIELASEMSLSRFFLDKKIPNDTALNLWQESIKNHCEGFADELVVAYYDGDPSGIVALKINKNDIYMHIVGVLRPYWGKNIATKLIRGVIDKYSASHEIYVQTQSTNIKAQRLYQKCGFNFYDIKYILHWWR